MNKSIGKNKAFVSKSHLSTLLLKVLVQKNTQKVPQITSFYNQRWLAPRFTRPTDGYYSDHYYFAANFASFKISDSEAIKLLLSEFSVMRSLEASSEHTASVSAIFNS